MEDNIKEVDNDKETIIESSSDTEGKQKNKKQKDRSIDILLFKNNFIIK